MAVNENILKQDLIAGHLKVLYKEMRSIKRKLNGEDREEETGAGEQAQGMNFATDQRFTFDAVSVTSLVDDFSFLALRTIPTSLDSPGWVVDPEFQTKFLTITKPPNVDLPAVGDIVPAFFTGTYGSTPALPTARYGLFGTSGGAEQLVVLTHEADYLGCRTFINSVTGADTILVAKPFKLRSLPFSGLTYGGIAYSVYTTAQVRNATVSGQTRTQNIVPTYDTSEADLIYAQKVANTQVFVGGTELTLIDMNADGRGWATV